MASPYPGIDHHLSGPITFAWTQISLVASVVKASIWFLFAYQLVIVILANVIDSSVRVSRRVLIIGEAVLWQYVSRCNAADSMSRLPRLWFQLFRSSVGVFLNFPSRYLFAVDLLLILRLWWRLPSFTLQSQGALLEYVQLTLNVLCLRIYICHNGGSQPPHTVQFKLLVHSDTFLRWDLVWQSEPFSLAANWGVPVGLRSSTY